MADDGDDGALARTLMRSAGLATLATADAGRAGWPCASLVQTACAADAAPLLLLSELAVHTRNIAADDRVSLLYAAPGDVAGALTRPRVTVYGRAAPTADRRLLGRYLAHHPGARGFAGFADFHLYRVAVSAAHLVAGFGRIVDLDRAAVTFDAAPALVEAAGDIVAHMNDDHADAVALYATRLLGRDGTDWRIAAIDPEGCDLVRPPRDGDAPDAHRARLDFAQPVADPGTARAALVRLARRARAAG